MKINLQKLTKCFGCFKVRFCYRHRWHQTQLLFIKATGSHFFFWLRIRGVCIYLGKYNVMTCCLLLAPFGSHRVDRRSLNSLTTGRKNDTSYRNPTLRLPCTVAACCAFCAFLWNYRGHKIFNITRFNR